MRVESIGLRTWLLAAFAGWAALAAILTVFGLGRRVELLPDDPQLAQRLPALPAPAPERLQALTQYPEIAAQPVFAEDRQPHPFFLTSDDDAKQASALRLTGVLLTPKFQMATVTTEQGQSLRLRLSGDRVEGWRLLALQPRSATLEGPGGTQTLELQVFSGQGGQPPTVLGVRPGQAPPAPPPPSTSIPEGSPLPNPSAAPSGKAAPAQAGSGEGANATPKPSEDQMTAIRERIEARRRQLQQQRQNGASSAQKP